jgi:hypothetical protein
MERLTETMRAEEFSAFLLEDGQIGVKFMRRASGVELWTESILLDAAMAAGLGHALIECARQSRKMKSRAGQGPGSRKH